MACVLCGIDSTWTHRPCRIDISQIRYHIALVLCEIESTYVKSNLRIFDMTWAAKIDSTVKSILAAPDPREGQKDDQKGASSGTVRTASKKSLPKGSDDEHS